MKKIISTLLVAGCCLTSLMAQDVVVKGPDENCNWLSLLLLPKSQVIPLPIGKTMLEKSPLGMNTNIGDFAKGMKLTGHTVTPIDTVYHQDRIKTSQVYYQANGAELSF